MGEGIDQRQNLRDNRFWIRGQQQDIIRIQKSFVFHLSSLDTLDIYIISDGSCSRF